jgi:hypothetical protein
MDPRRSINTASARPTPNMPEPSQLRYIVEMLAAAPHSMPLRIGPLPRNASYVKNIVSKVKNWTCDK